MGNQFRESGDASHDDTLSIQKEQQRKDLHSSENVSADSDAFHSHSHTRNVYTELDAEYSNRLTPMYANITRSRFQFPPYWDTKRNIAEQLPMYQHNVSSGRYHHSMTQLSLTYNSFFPNQSLSNSLIDVKVLESPFGESAKHESAESPSKEGQEKELPTPTKPDQLLSDQSALIEQGFDNIIKHSSWAKREHLKMVVDMMNYGAGIYKFDDPEGIRYRALDFTKVRVPTGTSTDPDEWEYIFIKHDISFSMLLKHWEEADEIGEFNRKGWNKKTLTEYFRTALNNAVTQTNGKSGVGVTANQNEAVQDIRAGLLGLPNLSTVCPSTIPVISCYWKNKQGKVSVNTMLTPSLNPGIEGFIYEYDNQFESFCQAFSLFPADDSIDELRMVRGWGERIFHLCHAYDRAFCKFLDNIEYAATLFLDMDPNDLYQKVVNFGSLTVGKIDNIQAFPNALKAIIEALLFLDSKIDSVTFTRGLNKTELMGDGRGAEIASILLTMEGRVHKHLMSRFHERYTVHYRELLRRMLKITNEGKESSKTLDREVVVKFSEFLQARGVPKRALQSDDTSDVNNGLPSHWVVVCRKPDGTGITSTTPHVIQALQPYLSSLPESGFKYLLSRVISDAFGDEDMIQKLLPGSDLAKVSSEADLQMAELQAAVLTTPRSEFDKELVLVEELDPRTLDANKFMTFPSAKQNDNIIFLKVLLKKVDDAVETLNRREIGRTTLHIWLYNLVSTAQGHVDDLRSDAIRAERPEAQELMQRFGKAFNLFRQVESQANSERAKKLDEAEKRVAEQEQNDPKQIEAQAKLLTARAKMADVQRQYSSDSFVRSKELNQERRAEEAHIIDSQVKLSSIRKNNMQSQSLLGRPGLNEQRGNE